MKMKQSDRVYEDIESSLKRQESTKDKKSKLKSANESERMNLGESDMKEESSHANEERLITLRTRTSPRVLHDAISGLTDAHEKTVREMGLGVLLEMTLNGIPSKIGFYVVDALDTKKMHLKVHQGVIPISVESVHELLGLPMGGINLVEVDEEESERRILNKWREKFGKRKMRPMDLLDAIQKSDEAGFTFN